MVALTEIEGVLFHSRVFEIGELSGELKPGLFATARIEQPARTPGVLVPAAAVHTASGTMNSTLPPPMSIMNVGAVNFVGTELRAQFLDLCGQIRF